MRNATLGAMITGFVGILALAFTGGPGMAWPLVALFGLAYGTQQTVYFALAMKYTVPSIAASMFAILDGSHQYRSRRRDGCQRHAGGCYEFPDHFYHFGSIELFSNSFVADDFWAKKNKQPEISSTILPILPSSN